MKKNIVLTMFLALGLISCGKKEKPKPPIPHVDVQVANAYDVPYVFDYPGIVQGVVDYPVVPRVSGAIFKQFYTEGTYVKKDTLLYQIDPRPFQYNLNAYQGQLIKDQAAMQNYKIIYDRYQTLYKTNAVSLQDVETALINYKAAEGNVKTDLANIEQEKLNLEYCQVKAPADGYIAERQVTVGDMVTAWQTQLNTINSVNDMYVLFSMPENDRLTIQQGMIESKLSVPSSYKFRIDVELADGSVMQNAGYVEFTDTRISLQNGVWNLRGYVDNKDLRNKLLAGQFVHVYLHGAKFSNAYALPQVAIFRDDTGPFVYLLNSKNEVQKKYVTTGKMVKDLWVVNAGLDSGDKVIVNGGVKVAPGESVIVDKTITTATEVSDVITSAPTTQPAVERPDSISSAPIAASKPVSKVKKAPAKKETQVKPVAKKQAASAPTITKAAIVNTSTQQALNKANASTPVTSQSIAK